MRFIFCLALFFSFEQSLFAQTNIYHPFADSNAFWRVDHFDYSYPWPPYYIYTQYQYTLGGDTIIGNVTWKKLLISGLGYATVAELIRQDTAAKIIYIDPIHHGSFATDSILYDFNIQIGDTIPESWFQRAPTWYNYHVTNIDSILIGSDYRKRWEISDSVGLYQLHIIEGIGSDLGPIESWEFEEQIYYLRCYKENGISLYSDGGSFACDSIDRISENLVPEALIEIFPNPSTGTFFLHEKFIQNVNDISLTDALGKRAAIEVIQIDNSFFKINILNAHSGLYAVITQNKKKYSFKKIVVNN
ncbi:hypothetical protein BH11BAC1_BH11BAC1_19480 [soil metagenome]